MESLADVLRLFTVTELTKKPSLCMCVVISTFRWKATEHTIVYSSSFSLA